MRFYDIVGALAAHLLIAAAVLLATLPPENEPNGAAVDRNLDPVSEPSAPPAASAPTPVASGEPRFEVHALQKANRLLISGTVFGGRPCKRMQLQLRLQQASGPDLHHSLTVDRLAGSSTTSFRSERRITGPPPVPEAPWNVTVQSHRCQQAVPAE
ncbi:MAG TPA: hypothetical protein ACFCUC_06810 [Desulfobacterales bacterium]